MSNDAYIPYEKIADYLEIENGDIVYLASEVLGFIKICRENSEKFNADKFINSIIEKLGHTGTLLIPTFNWEFSNNGVYDYKNSPCTTGALGKAALKRDDFKRTKHPLHSFAVWGKDKELLCKINELDSYGEASPFQYMLDNNAKCTILGTDYKHAYTFIHFVEKKEKVPYRFTKKFGGTYIDENGAKTHSEYTSYVRYLDITLEEKFNEIGKIFEKSNAAKSITINNQQIKIVDISATYPIIVDDIKNRQCKNLYNIYKEG